MTSASSGARAEPRRARVSEWVDAAPAGHVAIGLFLVLTVVYGATATYRYPASTDVVNTVLPAYRLAADGTLDMTPYAEYIESRRVVEEQFVRVDGRWLSGRNPGLIAVATPFYLLPGTAPTAGSLPPLWPATIPAVLCTAGAMAILHLAFRSMLSPRHALGAALVAALATTTWSTASDMLWSHGPAMLFLATAGWALSRERDASAGVAVGAAMLMRPELAVSAAVLGLWLGVSSRSWSRVGRLALGPLVAALILLAYFTLVLGQFSPVAGHRNTVMLAESPSLAPSRLLSDVASVLTASRNGLLVYSPFLVLLLPGLPRAWRAAAPWVRAAAAAGLVHLGLIITIQGNGDGNYLFAYRFPLEMLTLAAPLLALVWREHVRRDRVWLRLFMTLVSASAVLHGLASVLEWRRLTG